MGHDSHLNFFFRCPTGFIIRTHPFGKFSCSHGDLNQSCSASQKRAESVFLVSLIAGTKTCSLWGIDRLFAAMGSALDSDVYSKVRTTFDGVAPFIAFGFLLFVFVKCIKKSKPHPDG